MQEMSKILKPCYNGYTPPTTNNIPLSVFDKVTFDSHVAVIYAYHPPPSNYSIELGLRKALSVYREWAGQLGEDDMGERVLVLNDNGIKFVEASVDDKLEELMLLKPSPSLLSLHPCLEGVTELMQVQLTRFIRGSLVVGFTSHHQLADGNATCQFLMAWSQACRGLDMLPKPFHDCTIFFPREHPIYEFEHRDVEITSEKREEYHPPIAVEDIVVHKFYFTQEFLFKLKEKASSLNIGKRPYTLYESLVTHLWRCITKTHALNINETTHVRISVNGRTRLNPKVPSNYFGNLVLWAFPSAKVQDLVREPISYATMLVHNAVTKVNNNYFKSFIDFASYMSKEEDFIPTTDMDQSSLWPNMEVDSWLRFPFHDLDFGRGCPYIFMPSYFPTEGMMFLLPSIKGDGSIDAFIPLFFNMMDLFTQVCYYLD